MTTEKREELIEAADWILDRLGVEANDPRLKGCTQELREIFWELHDRTQKRIEELESETQDAENSEEADGEDLPEIKAIRLELGDLRMGRR